MSLLHTFALLYVSSSEEVLVKIIVTSVFNIYEFSVSVVLPISVRGLMNNSFGVSVSLTYLKTIPVFSGMDIESVS